MVPVGGTDASIERPASLRTLMRFLAWMIQTDPRRAVASLSLQFTAGLLPAASVWIMRSMLDRSLDVYEGRLPVTAVLVWIALWAAMLLVEMGIRTWSRTILLERLKRLPGFLVGQLRLGQLPQFVVHQRQQLLSGRWIAGFDL